MTKNENMIAFDEGKAPSESGQSLALGALVFLMLLAFVALAVDVAFAFVRSSQFSAAVDAATLAGVVDLDPTTNDTVDADLRAEQFLAANSWPTDTLTTMVSTRTITVRGIPQYTLTVTWPVNLFFAKLLGFSDIPITHDATAAFYAQAEIFTTSAVERGQVRKASQFIYGPQACTQEGDPVSPVFSTPGNANLDYANYDGTYHYRISVSQNYTHSNVLRIELFDPDSYNNQINQATVSHSISDGGAPEILTCDGTTTGMGDRCVIATGESISAINQNPFWFQRVDENWLADCNPDPGNQFGNTVTKYELYYYDDSGGKQPLAEYMVDNNRDYINSDLKWVSPGAPGSLVPANSGSFEIDLTTVPTTSTNLRVINMDVTSPAGSGQNVWDLWAGPPPSYYIAQGIPVLDPNVNQRNLQLANNPALYNTKGVAVYAVGRLPATHYISGAEIRMPLSPIESELGGGTMYVTGFDLDASAPPGLPYFTIDTVAESDFKMYATVVTSPTEGHIGTPGDPLQATCSFGTNCDNDWLWPQLAMGVPDVFFFGGQLEANYTPSGDDHVWSVSVTAGRPILTR